MQYIHQEKQMPEIAAIFYRQGVSNLTRSYVIMSNLESSNLEPHRIVVLLDKICYSTYIYKIKKLISYNLF